MSPPDLALILSIIVLFIMVIVLLATRRSREQTDIYRKIADLSTEAVCITDSRTHIEYANQAYLATTGYTLKEVLGRTPAMMKSGRHDEAFYKEMWETLNETGTWQGEIWDRKKDGEPYPKWLTITALKDSRGAVTKYIGAFADMTSVKQTSEYIEHLMHFDALTNLPNRLLLNERMRQVSSSASRWSPVAALSINIIDFAKINNAFGFLVGDDLLTQVAGRLSRAALKGDVVARIGGDKFAVVLSGLKHPDEAIPRAQEFADVIAPAFKLKQHFEVHVSINIGVALFPHDGETPDRVMLHAESAMKHARASGVRIMRFATPLGETSYESLSIESNLRRAFDQGDFLLYYQPIVDLQQNRIIGSEPLIRRKETDWIVPPGKFIKVAEDSGLIMRMCEWTLNEACAESVSWQNEGLPPLMVSVNFTAMQFYRQDLVELVSGVLGKTGFDPRQLELELTERVIINDTDVSLKIMRDLKALGIRLSIDDFGTGYSSLGYLSKFPVDKLKIDISFVKGLPNDRGCVAISKSIIALAHTLGMKVIAEGVERKEQYEFLRDEGCDQIQGFYFGHPVPPAIFKTMITDKGILPAPEA